MSRVFNFSAGPAALPEEVLIQVRDEMLDWQGSGMSVMEMSHRGKEFMSIAAQAEADLRELLAIPDNYKVLFLQGGASAQFAMIPLNILGQRKTADYVVTGSWGKKAIKEAGKYCEARQAARPESFTDIPDPDTWQRDSQAGYLHYTPNETIEGVEFHFVPDTGEVPLVADFSSTFMSRPIEVSRFGLIYAGAQKNVGPAGLTLVIVRDDLLDRARADTPMAFNLAEQAAADSMLNTPPCFSWYVAGLVFQWLKRKGGLAAMAECNEHKAGLLYNAIDASAFYANPVNPECRSWMNVPFTLADAELDAVFLKEAATAGLSTLKGHRSVGGIAL